MNIRLTVDLVSLLFHFLQMKEINCIFVGERLTVR